MFSDGSNWFSFLHVKPQGQSSKGSHKKQSTEALIRLQVYACDYLVAKRIESYSATGKNVSGTLKDLADIYNDTRVSTAKKKLLNAKREALQNSSEVQAFIPGVKAYFGSKSCLQLFTTFLSTVQVVTAVVDVVYSQSELQKIGIRIANGIDAQVGLTAPRTFSEHVRVFVEHQIESVPVEQKDQHFFFLYHPDTDWHAHFAEALKKKPLPNELIAMSENLDALVTYMRFFRWHLKKRSKKKGLPLRESVFHLLIPAYRPMLIKNALKFPDLGMMVIHGVKHNSEPYVWLNLPSIDKYAGAFIALAGVGNMARPASKWKWPAHLCALGSEGAAIYGSLSASAMAASPVLIGIGITAVGVYGMYQTYCAIEGALAEEKPRLLGEPEPEPEKPEADDRSITAVYGDSGSENEHDEKFVKHRHTKHVKMRKPHDDPGNSSRKKRRERKGK